MLKIPCIFLCQPVVKDILQQYVYSAFPDDVTVEEKQSEIDELLQ